ncbi:MAG: patatin-like phospholipase family protein [Chloroflexi bacterium]|nr:patatin-like phospholipase family protein [Chloroflexota bacterium]
MQAPHREFVPPTPRSRQKVGLVLGAGGVRGCAHAGVIEVLREAGVEVDVVVGASIGAMFGLAVAARWPTDRIVTPAREATSADLVRFYASRLRTSAANPISRYVYEVGAGKTFADLPLPFAVVASDMAAGRLVVLDSGPVLPAVEASIALPFIARPVALGDTFFLDGGLLDSVPVHVARRMGADRVIAVCLGSNFKPPHFLRKRPWTRPWLERIGAQSHPARGRWRDQIRFGCRLYAASYDPPLPAQEADVAIWPEFGRIGPNSMYGGSFCYRQGVSAARAALPNILRAVSHEL